MKNIEGLIKIRKNEISEIINELTSVDFERFDKSQLLQQILDNKKINCLDETNIDNKGVPNPIVDMKPFERGMKKAVVIYTLKAKGSSLIINSVITNTNSYSCSYNENINELSIMVYTNYMNPKLNEETKKYVNTKIVEIVDLLNDKIQKKIIMCNEFNKNLPNVIDKLLIEKETQIKNDLDLNSDLNPFK